MDVATAASFATTTIDNIGETLTLGLPAVLLVLAALIGLGILIRYIKRWVGRK